MRNWEDVLPKMTAERQHSWDKRMRIFRAYKAGAKRKEIAKAMGLSHERIRQIIIKAEREMKNDIGSPIEQYFNQLPWRNADSDMYQYERFKRNFDETTKSGRKNIRRAAKNFILGRKP